MKKYLTLFLFALISTISFAQDNYQDVVYLKNGSIIRGVIIEQVPNKSIKIETADNSIFVCQFDEIEKITKEKPISKKNNQLGRKKGFIGLELGANLPIGKFADENDGAAKTGLQINFINFGYLFSENIGITATWFGASNPIEGFGSDYLWAQGGLLIGPLFSIPFSEKVEWDIKPMVGLSRATITNIGLEYSIAKYEWDLGDQSMGTLAIKGGVAFRLN